jgi:hypothetical protein
MVQSVLEGVEPESMKKLPEVKTSREQQAISSYTEESATKTGR